MAFFLKHVDRTTVNYDTFFTYTLDVSFSGLTDNEVNPARIEDILPDYITDISFPALDPSITPTIAPYGVNQQKITLTFATITDTGIAYRINIKCRFADGTADGSTCTNNAQVFLAGSDTASYTASAPTVTLKIVAQWDIQKIMSSPVNNNPTPEGFAYYTISLRNSGDRGASLNNFSVYDIIPTGMKLDPLFTPVVQNLGGGTITPPLPLIPVIDPSEQWIRWNITTYTGNYLYFVIRVVVATDVQINTQLTNTVQLLDSNNVVLDYSNQISTVTSQLPQTGVGKYGPSHSSAGQLISYELYMQNNGNQNLTNLEVIDTIPPNVVIQKVFPGNFGIRESSIYPAETFHLYYSTDPYSAVTPTWTEIGTGFPYGYNPYWTYYNLPVTPNKVTRLRWFFPVANINFTQIDGPRLDGVIDTNPVPADVAVNNLSYTTTQTPTPQTVTFTTYLDGIAQINGSKDGHPTGDVEPTDTIKYEGIINAVSSPISDPVVIDLLPLQVEYVGNVTASYADYFTNQWNWLPIADSLIDVLTEDNYNNTGRTRVRITVSPFLLTQRSVMRVSFDTTVKPGYRGIFQDNMLIGNDGPSIAYPPYEDTSDQDGDGITDEQLLITNNVYNNIIFSTKYASDKKIKGALDDKYTEWPDVGNTYDGGPAQYELSFINNSNTDYMNIVMVDILPHVGDTGVIVSTPRGSQFPVYLGNNITATLTPPYPGDPAPVITIEYSESYNPQRFTIPGVNDWTTTPPSPITNAKSFKITTGANTMIRPGQTLTVYVDCVVPLGVSEGLIAWNSFALQGDFINEAGDPDNLPPVEPEKAGIQVQLPDSTTVTLGDFVWNDLNFNGVYDTGEPGVNGITVQLHSSDYDPDNPDASLIAQTTTANNSLNQPGNYIFQNIPAGEYYIKFITPSQYALTVQRETLPNGSKPNRTTGLTDLITTVTVEGSEDLTIDAGVIPSNAVSSVGDTVWIDENRNGILEPGEKGQAGVLVTLYDENGIRTEYSAITDSNGKYLIENVLPQQYYAVFSNIPQDYIFITANNYVTNTGVSPNLINVTPATFINTVDAPIAFNTGLIGPQGPEGPSGCCYTYNNLNTVYFDNQQVQQNACINFGVCAVNNGEFVNYKNNSNYIMINGQGSFMVNYSANASFMNDSNAEDYIALQFKLNNSFILPGYSYITENGIIQGSALIETNSCNNLNSMLCLTNVGTTDITLNNLNFNIVRIS